MGRRRHDKGVANHSDPEACVITQKGKGEASAGEITGQQLLLKLMLEDCFPRIWTSSLENGDLRQLLWHRNRLVQMRTLTTSQLQALAMNEGQRSK